MGWDKRGDDEICFGMLPPEYCVVRSGHRVVVNSLWWEATDPVEREAYLAWALSVDEDDVEDEPPPPPDPTAVQITRAVLATLPATVLRQLDEL